MRDQTLSFDSSCLGGLIAAPEATVEDKPCEIAMALRRRRLPLSIVSPTARRPRSSAVLLCETGRTPVRSPVAHSRFPTYTTLSARSKMSQCHACSHFSAHTVAHAEAALQPQVSLASLDVTL